MVLVLKNKFKLHFLHKPCGEGVMTPDPKYLLIIYGGKSAVWKKKVKYKVDSLVLTQTNGNIFISNSML